MRVKFTSADGAGIATYTTDWHTRQGVRVYREVTIARRFTYSRLLRREAVEYTIRHVEYGEDGREAVKLNSSGVSTFSAALDVLGRELSRLVAAGFARGSDLERLPASRRARPVGA